jgi:hypothetical protein
MKYKQINKDITHVFYFSLGNYKENIRDHCKELFDYQLIILIDSQLSGKLFWQMNRKIVDNLKLHHKQPLFFS